MAATKTPGSKRAGGGGRAPKPMLPPITVGKFEDTGRLLERVVAENQTIFIEKGQAYKEQHRQGSSRPLTALEAAQVAVAVTDDDPVAKAAEIQQSELKAYDEPDVREILLSAGLATAPAIIRAFRSVVALVEMPNDVYEQAYEDGTLDQAIEHAAELLRGLPLAEARERTQAMAAHYAQAAGFDAGEALGLPVKAIWQALQNATSQLVDASASSQLTGSAASTTGPAVTSDSSGG